MKWPVALPGSCRSKTANKRENTKKTATKIAMPPPRGTGVLFMRLGPGLSTMPKDLFISLTTGVKRSESARDPRKASANGTMRNVTEGTP